MTNEQKKIRALFRGLAKAPKFYFPDHRQRLHAPIEHGVYVIYSPKGRALHVGRTPRGKRGLSQRLKNHLHAASSFTNIYLKGDGAKLRRTHFYRFITVKSPRLRALLEAFAIGRLCPAHIGLNLVEG